MKQFMSSMILVIAIFSLTGCGGSDETASNWDVDTNGMHPKDNGGDWIIVHELSDSDGLNPYTSTGAGGTYIYSQNIFEAMMVQDNQSLEYIPWIAANINDEIEDLPEYSAELRNKLCEMFAKFEIAHQKEYEGQRKHFPSFSFVLYKFLEILKKYKHMEHIP